ncbi:MAG: ABC transporter ATP-binding protein [Betaproteobacteria bacterium]|jgi:ABC-type glutathione transport system ATPase component|nr:ABC transporter ATP-binding protein [Nitrosomonadales bacterium]NCX68298.1 ABC transporter ATP-binding protein [Betaproteobacteria bacterium]
MYIDVRNLKKTYTKHTGFLNTKSFTVNALDDVSFSVKKGQCLAIVGESGSGKSTLAKTVMKLLSPDSGEINFMKQNIVNLSSDETRIFRKKIQMIFQDPFSSLNPKFTIRQILSEPLEIHMMGDKDEIESKVIEHIKLVGLSEDDLSRYPHQFSGGQRQRICIARALIIKPEVIVCDEPVSALDVSIQAQILELLKKLQKKFQLTYLFITHDLRVVKYIADEVIVLQNGKLVEKGSVTQLFNKPSTDYTKALIEAIPGSI